MCGGIKQEGPVLFPMGHRADVSEDDNAMPIEDIGGREDLGEQSVGDMLAVGQDEVAVCVRSGAGIIEGQTRYDAVGPGPGANEVLAYLQEDEANPLFSLQEVGEPG